LEGVGERTVFVALCVLDANLPGKEAEHWLHSDESEKRKREEPKPKLTAKERTLRRHPRPGGMPAKEAVAG
jgi:hypothetical protein